MKASSNPRLITLSVLLITLSISASFVPAVTAQSQTTGVAIQRGYRTGYSDGYMSGYRDTIDSLSKSYERHAEYTKADRAYNKEYGAMDDYRDGYQQGFESGYQIGFDRRAFESNPPTALKKRGVNGGDSQTSQNSAVGGNTANTIGDAGQTDDPSKINGQAATSYQSTTGAIVIIPCDTELIVELGDDINTEQSREGQKFTAKIVSPSEIAGATIEGRIAKVLKPGRIKRRSELLLSFDRIILNDARWSNFSAILTEVLAVKGDNVSRVDVEGTAVGQSSLKSDAIKVGGATGVGLVTGAFVAGPVGAAVGAGVGAAFGVGAVVIDRGKHIRLNKNQQLRIKTAHETQIR